MAEKKSGLFTFVACTVQPWGTAWVLSGPAFSIPTMPLTADLGNHALIMIQQPISRT